MSLIKINRKPVNDETEIPIIYSNPNIDSSEVSEITYKINFADKTKNKKDNWKEESYIYERFLEYDDDKLYYTDLLYYNLYFLNINNTYNADPDYYDITQSIIDTDEEYLLIKPDLVPEGTYSLDNSFIITKTESGKFLIRISTSDKEYYLTLDEYNTICFKETDSNHIYNSKDLWKFKNGYFINNDIKVYPLYYNSTIYTPNPDYYKVSLEYVDLELNKYRFNSYDTTNKTLICGYDSEDTTFKILMTTNWESENNGSPVEIKIQCDLSGDSFDETKEFYYYYKDGDYKCLDEDNDDISIILLKNKLFIINYKNFDKNKCDTVKLTIIPIMKFGELTLLKKEFIINCEDIESGKCTVNEWRYYIKSNTDETNTLCLDYGFLLNISDDIYVQSANINFYEFNSIVGNDNVITLKTPSYILDINDDIGYSGSYNRKIILSDETLKYNKLYLAEIYFNIFNYSSVVAQKEYRWIYTNQQYLSNNYSSYLDFNDLNLDINSLVSFTSSKPSFTPNINLDFSEMPYYCPEYVIEKYANCLYQTAEKNILIDKGEVYKLYDTKKMYMSTKASIRAGVKYKILPKLNKDSFSGQEYIATIQSLVDDNNKIIFEHKVKINNDNTYYLDVEYSEATIKDSEITIYGVILSVLNSNKCGLTYNDKNMIYEDYIPCISLGNYNYNESSPWKSCYSRVKMTTSNKFDELDYSIQFGDDERPWEKSYWHGSFNNWMTYGLKNHYNDGVYPIIPVLFFTSHAGYGFQTYDNLQCLGNGNYVNDNFRVISSFTDRIPKILTDLKTSMSNLHTMYQNDDEEDMGFGDKLSNLIMGELFLNLSDSEFKQTGIYFMITYQGLFYVCTGDDIHKYSQNTMFIGDLIANRLLPYSYLSDLSDTIDITLSYADYKGYNIDSIKLYSYSNGEFNEELNDIKFTGELEDDSNSDVNNSSASIINFTKTKSTINSTDITLSIDYTINNKKISNIVNSNKELNINFANLLFSTLEFTDTVSLIYQYDNSSMSITTDCKKVLCRNPYSKDGDYFITIPNNRYDVLKNKLMYFDYTTQTNSDGSDEINGFLKSSLTIGDTMNALFDKKILHDNDKYYYSTEAFLITDGDNISDLKIYISCYEINNTSDTIQFSNCKLDPELKTFAISSYYGDDGDDKPRAWFYNELASSLYKIL